MAVLALNRPQTASSVLYLVLEGFAHMGRAVIYRFSLALLTLTVFVGPALAAPARAQVIPESGTLALFGSGLVGLAALIRRHFSE